ncbi:phosphonates metabolism transcriptional regulator PhnF [Hoeflea sp. IMCC20628]|uniref:phosphonate metabolism transcriptional regulator PhnF n=1 Tax=Hoeflea sp. IMCC20628 TaxID=1620421 RepID=UPI00063AB219|nr:phosphonate metabolism transcriptional regulator PhnF [Hoeflea sp. IMCC20628]AKI00070.1 phosphonates metabolism transcriptional regulator PhnF [Hoeflea sp. IMCC20628]
MKTVQRRTGIALWRQVADQIRQSVLTGLAPDERLPSEAELATRFGVNRHTVRAAIAALEKEGILRAEQGRGTFLNDRKRLRYPIGQRTRFSSGLENQAQTRSGKLLSSKTLPAPLHVSTALSLPESTPVIELSTVSAADGVPVSAATSWFDAARFAQIADLYAETGSITASLALLGVDDYTRKTTAIEARHASSEDLDLLALSPGAIVLLTRAIDIDSRGQPVLYGESRFAADRVELLIDNDASKGNGDTG